MTNFNGLTEAETERLAYLSEELAEVQQVVGKILRHGYLSYNPVPEHPDFGVSNRVLLVKEIKDVMKAIHLMEKAGDVPYVIERLNPSGKYMHHQQGLTP